MTEMLRAVKGMNDVFESELATWRFIEKTASEIFFNHGYQEIRTPILEDVDLFVRSIGEATDIVEKEMYVLDDKGGKSLCLRPENTAGVVRALIEHNILAQEQEFKAYYFGPMFRRERPQKGRLRQFHQLGVEAVGIEGPKIDIEVMAMLHQLFEALGLTDLKFYINSMGSPEERKEFTKTLVSYFSQYASDMCGDCQRRLHTNPLRILDCKVARCQEIAVNAPKTIDSLQEESARHFDAIQNGLAKLNVQFEVAPRLVRGLDYYTRTVFELVSAHGLGTQNTVAGGGRYDLLIERLGGKGAPAIGFAAGIERIVLMLQDKALNKSVPTPDLVLVHADESGDDFIDRLCFDLRKMSVSVERDLKQRSVKAQFRRADRLNAKSVIVIGESEITKMSAGLKVLSNGQVTEVTLTAGAIRDLLRSS